MGEVTPPQPRVLLVEDDVEVARAISRILRGYRYDVVVIGCCAELPPEQSRFDVGVFDIELPDGDGVALAHTALECRVVKRAVFFSGTSEPNLLRSAQELGPLSKKMEGVMPLVQHIRQALKSTKRRAVGEMEIDVVSSSPPPPPGLRRTNK